MTRREFRILIASAALSAALLFFGGVSLSAQSEDDAFIITEKVPEIQDTSITSAALPAEKSAQMDSLYLERVKTINDYDLLGVQYGVALSTMSFQPTRNASMNFEPLNIGIVYTHYCKLFGYMPYFGVQLGLFYTQEAYHFTTSDTGYTDHILGAAKAKYEVLEVPAMAQIHFDFWKMKVMASVGIFGGYRMSIHREEYTYPSYYEQYGEYQNRFHEKENRWDYGIKAGAGFAFVLDPIEIHLNAWFKYSWSNMHQPNCDRFYQPSTYYYYWTYPMNIIVSVGVHYQLTKRKGITRRDLRREAASQAREEFLSSPTE